MDYNSLISSLFIIIADQIRSLNDTTSLHVKIYVICSTLDGEENNQSFCNAPQRTTFLALQTQATSFAMSAVWQ